MVLKVLQELDFYSGQLWKVVVVATFIRVRPDMLVMLYKSLPETDGAGGAG